MKRPLTYKELDLIEQEIHRIIKLENPESESKNLSDLIRILQNSYISARIRNAMKPKIQKIRTSGTA